MTTNENHSKDTRSSCLVFHLFTNNKKEINYTEINENMMRYIWISENSRLLGWNRQLIMIA